MEHTQRFTDLVLLHRANAVEEFSGIDEHGRAAQVIVLAETADAAGHRGVERRASRPPHPGTRRPVFRAQVAI